MEYFSKFNRDKHYIALVMWDVLSTWVNDPGSQLTKKEKQKLRYAIDHIWNVSQSILGRNGEDYTKRMLRDLQEKKLEIIRASKLRSDQVQLDIDLLYDIADVAILACNLQDKETCIRFQQCQTYQSMFAAGIPPCVLTTDACPYRAESYDKKTKAWTMEMELPDLHVLRPYKQAVCQNCGAAWYAMRTEEQSDTCPDCHSPLSEWR